MKKLFAFLLATTLVASMATTAFATVNPPVQSAGGEGSVRIEPGSEPNIPVTPPEEIGGTKITTRNIYFGEHKVGDFSGTAGWASADDTATPEDETNVGLVVNNGNPTYVGTPFFVFVSIGKFLDPNDSTNEVIHTFEMDLIKGNTGFEPGLGALNEDPNNIISSVTLTPGGAATEILNLKGAGNFGAEWSGLLRNTNVLASAGRPVAVMTWNVQTARP